MEEAYEAKVKALEEKILSQEANLATNEANVKAFEAKIDKEEQQQETKIANIDQGVKTNADRLSFDLKLPYCCASTTDDIHQAMRWCSYHKTWLKMKLPLF